MRSGQRLRSRMFDVKRQESAFGHVRVAIVVPKFAFTAVARNRLKRRVRELARQHLLTRGSSCDVLVRARKDAYAAEYDRLRDDIAHIAAQLT